jgi:hypothetical protein
MSPCEGWLCFIVGQKQSSSRLVILKSRSMSPEYFLYVSFNLWICRYRVYWNWNLLYLLRILKVIVLKSNPLSSILKVIVLKSNPIYGLTNNNGSIGKGTLSGTVLWEMLTELFVRSYKLLIYFFLISFTLNHSSHI